MKYLLLDSSSAFLAVAIYDEKKLIGKTFYPCFQRQSEYMILEIDKLLKKLKLTMFDINGIVVSIGPGSYTGIRIALTIAKVASFALNIPLYPISTLECYKLIGKDSIVLFNARSNRSYIASFSKNKRLLKDQVMNNDDVLLYIKKHPRFHLIGDLSYLNLIGEEVDILKNMSLLFKNIKPINDPSLVKPIYLKETYL